MKQQETESKGDGKKGQNRPETAGFAQWWAEYQEKMQAAFQIQSLRFKMQVQA